MVKWSANSKSKRQEQENGPISTGTQAVQASEHLTNHNAGSDLLSLEQPTATYPVLVIDPVATRVERHVVFERPVKRCKVLGECSTWKPSPGMPQVSAETMFMARAARTSFPCVFFGNAALKSKRGWQNRSVEGAQPNGTRGKPRGSVWAVLTLLVPNTEIVENVMFDPNVLWIPHPVVVPRSMSQRECLAVTTVHHRCASPPGHCDSRCTNESK